MNRTSLPPNAKIIGSHVFCKRKGTGFIKARSVPRGHKDDDKDDLRVDAPCSNLEIFRLLLLIVTKPEKKTVFKMGIKAPCLQAQDFSRDIYFRSPHEKGPPPNIL